MKIQKENIIKSPLNYYGNKSKLLPQILPMFPSNINNFYDVFCGGLDVSLNVQANNINANDKHEDLIWLWNEILKYNSDSLGDELLTIDRKCFPMNDVDGKSLNTYGRTGDKDTWNKLMNQKREVYYKLREEFNNLKDKDFKTVILLSLNSVGLQDSFKIDNRKIKFTCGNNRVNKNNQNSLNNIADKIKHIKFTNNDFRYIKDIDFKENDFIYLDPPYLHTSQYEIKWNEQDEKDLYNLLDYLHNNNVKFALSNFADGKNHDNEYLKEWCGKYNIHYLNNKHTNLDGISKKGKRQEILVTNYTY
jgi:DNA adenine methylase Dam